MLSDKIPVISVVGPTASGKTDLALEICNKLNGEVVSADSMQIYREFNICTAKPDIFQMKAVKHHLIDILSVGDEFSVADYVLEAGKSILEIVQNGKLPVLAGGTGLYIDSLFNNVQFEDKGKDINLRNRLMERVNNGGIDGLINHLKEIDHVSAGKIHLNDIKRIIRAIEFYHTAGYPISLQSRESVSENSIYDVCWIGIGFKNREILYKRINDRVDKMVQYGIVDECIKISGNEISKTASGAIGYKEIVPFLKGEKKFTECIEDIKRETRRYAKRQITWFKRNKGIRWFYTDEYNNTVDMKRDCEKYILESSAYKLWQQTKE